MTLEGIVVPIVTPLLTTKGDKRVDEKGLRKLVNHVLDGRVNCVFVNGTTGEFSYLTSDEKMDAAEIVATEVNGRVPVYVGVTGLKWGETLTNVRYVNTFLTYGYPISGVVYAPTFMESYQTEEQLIENIMGVLKVSNLPMLLYNLPGWNVIPPEVLKNILKEEKIIGIKDSSGDIRNLEQYIKFADDKVVLQGNETQMLEAFRLGAKGAVPSMANLYPELCVSLWQGREHSEELQLEVVRRGVGVYRNYKKTIWGIKRALVELGVISTDITFTPVGTEEDKAQIAKLVLELKPSSNYD